MHLWTEYVGRTIAEAYPLEKLLTPEGRSAFFSTSNGTNTPAVIRIIETHFDESEILARWQQVAELQQPNLITLRKFGQDQLDGTPLVYAVMEPSDANLADVLRDRPLTAQETRDIATSLVGALQALHAGNLIHEHIEPANVLAVGETVKLRSDCVREAPEGDEGIALRARDVHDLAVVLLQSLTLRQTVPGTPLPSPFDAVIRNGISGAWSLDQIAAAVAPPAPAAKLPSAPISSAPISSAPVAIPVAKPAAASVPVQSAAAAATAATAAVPDTFTTSAASATARPTSSAYGSATAALPRAVHTTPPSVRDRLIQPVEDAPQKHRALWIGGAAVLLLVVILLWRSVHSGPATSAAPAAIPAQSTAAGLGARPAATPAPISTKPSAGRPGRSLKPLAKPASPGDAKTQWRVVSFTYNRQDQAQKKADTIAAEHAGLHPEVFSATGHAPYLVTLGGPMTRDQAASLREKARNSGLPRDTYIQNYSR